MQQKEGQTPVFLMDGNLRNTGVFRLRFLYVLADITYTKI